VLKIHAIAPGFTLTEGPNLLSFAVGTDWIETVAHNMVGKNILEGAMP
jgi:hypothetical protein